MSFIACTLVIPLPHVWHGLYIAHHAQADSLQKYMTLHSYDVYLIVLLSSGVALSYNVVHSLMIQHTSAVATTVIGEVRRLTRVRKGLGL